MTGAGELAMSLGHAHAEIEEVRVQATAEVDDLRTRLAEVEERLDFAERLLAHGEAANQLPGGPRQ